MILHVTTKTGGYDVTVRRGALCDKQSFNVPRGGKTLVVTDDGVPDTYVKAVTAHFEAPVTVTLPQGEQSKSFENYALLLRTLTEHGFTRHDKAVAVGGGVVGDLCGFAAATYMRGIAFYNVPTTFLSQVDSSIGGKTAIDFCGVKNVVGAFYPPAAVIADPDVLKTLSPRQLHAGVAESVKMAVTGDGELFALLEESALSPETFDKNAEKIIIGSLQIKKSVVESDPEEKGLRKVLNFGHTAGHAIESEYGGKLLHGECVALGMLPFAAPEIRPRLSALLARYGLPV
ncbi:MAG: 3-dehydroquinate synthase family protein, partial [Candidatus Scatosoma sp.]